MSSLEEIKVNGSVCNNNCNEEHTFTDDNNMCSVIHSLPSVEGGEYGHVKMVKITPPVARGLLRINLSNRPKSKQRSDSYKKMMCDYSWCVGADAIIVTTENELGNGQTRLTAFLESELPELVMMVRYGVNPEEFRYIDKQRGRRDYISNRIPKVYDELILLLHKLSSKRSQALNVDEKRNLAEKLKEAYAASQIVSLLKVAKNRSMLAAFVYSYLLAKEPADKFFVLNKWRIFNCGVTKSDHEDDKYTNMMIALNSFASKVKRSFECAFDLFKRALPMFVEGEHQNVCKAPPTKVTNIQENIDVILGYTAEKESKGN